MLDFRHYLSFDHLKDGSPVFVRAIRPEDNRAVLRAYQHLSERSIYYRFMRPKWHMTLEEASWFTDVDFVSHVAVAVGHYGPDSESPLGIGRYILLPGQSVRRAEFSCAVMDDCQGQGVGPVLLKHLVHLGRQQGIEEFVAEVLPQNRGMIRVFAKSGLPVRSFHDDGLLRINLDLRRGAEQGYN
ncbi:GNAT family N-acetyltransferase [Gallaecimonas sp. GXIMD4217]|uniref:GNAT family N-acetyltransferase n=1 Tax=Gallaecimonas sp. GXIMD4217 TaxID=3131927 RepID=UPI00311ABBFF